MHTHTHTHKSAEVVRCRFRSSRQKETSEILTVFVGFLFRGRIIIKKFLHHSTAQDVVYAQDGAKQLKKMLFPLLNHTVKRKSDIQYNNRARK